MALDAFRDCELPATADFHVHLRDGETMETVVPTIRRGGVNTVYVMPNLLPPITTVPHALSYLASLQRLEPNVTFLMTLYLHPTLTPGTIAEAARAGIAGVKAYPAGLTTNSAAGVVDYATFDAVFAAMEAHDLVLNLHGEAPSSPANGVSVLNAEEAFLPTLAELHAKFPRLRIVLEHCTSKAAVEAVRSIGSDRVRATITAHHLWLTVDDWAGDPFAFCKPVAKSAEDRQALIRAVVDGSGKFFLGTDSAPHPVQAKTGGTDRKGKIAAGVFTQPYATQLVVGALEKACEEGILKAEDVTKEVLENFMSGYGRYFYRVPNDKKEKIVLRKRDERVVDVLTSKSGRVEIVPFRRGENTWSVEWLP
ncbi:hypothetical protein BDY21DRAFT_386295 [Lineolata rhizophorae]|uniref:dihydroorotase n=1 Tax=Lineolata rhizophorae TaxID=578093 RepID=A0A6A6NYS7_9PEZI|nr:hypothetical protein BDY21DRAFT_386295 [Lineolata rhizophorae]